MNGWRKNIEQGLFTLLLLLIPNQLGRHFWPSWSYVNGLRIDYLSPTIYLIDLIWLGLVGITFSINVIIKWFRNHYFETIITILFILLNISIAENKAAAGYRWFRLAEVGYFIYYVGQNKKLVRERLKYVIPWWIISEAMLGWMQIATSGSVGGWWYWLGERRFDYNTLGIAQMSFLGRGLVRAYGSFSHPNSLAGFMAIVWMWWFFYKPEVRKWFWWLVCWLGIITIFISGSRVIWLLMIIFLGIQIQRKTERIYLLIVYGICCLGIWGWISQNYGWGGWDILSLSKRWDLNLIAGQLFWQNMWLGVGAGNFIVRLPSFQNQYKMYWLQPVHNIILLGLSEVGLLGCGVFGWYLLNKIKGEKKDYMMWLMLGVIGITGMADHYWLTLPQNSWLLGLILGVL